MAAWSVMWLWNGQRTLPSCVPWQSRLPPRAGAWQKRLMDLAESEAGNRTLLLKTRTIGPWAERRGYFRANPDQIPESVKGTTEFEGSLCSGYPAYVKPVAGSTPASCWEPSVPKGDCGCRG